MSATPLRISETKVIQRLRTTIPPIISVCSIIREPSDRHVHWTLIVSLLIENEDVATLFAAAVAAESPEFLEVKNQNVGVER
jgi:hypothetical protein